MKLGARILRWVGFTTCIVGLLMIGFVRVNSGVTPRLVVLSDTTTGALIVCGLLAIGCGVTLAVVSRLHK
jgi:hypothetical protein